MKSSKQRIAQNNIEQICFYNHFEKIKKEEVRLICSKIRHIPNITLNLKFKKYGPKFMHQGFVCDPLILLKLKTFC